MARQNIYDDECFFEGYKKIRQNEINANTLFEIPELFALLPDLNGKTILDMGCGFGEHCTKFVELGAATVVGIDISKKMLEVAEAENGHPSISYIHMPIEEISQNIFNNAQHTDSRRILHRKCDRAAADD